MGNMVVADHLRPAAIKAGQRKVESGTAFLRRCLVSHGVCTSEAFLLSRIAIPVHCFTVDSLANRVLHNIDVFSNLLLSKHVYGSQVPPLSIRPPGHGYSLGAWSNAWDLFARNAVACKWEKNETNTATRRRGGLTP